MISRVSRGSTQATICFYNTLYQGGDGKNLIGYAVGMPEILLNQPHSPIVKEGGKSE